MLQVTGTGQGDCPADLLPCQTSTKDLIPAKKGKTKGDNSGRSTRDTSQVYHRSIAICTASRW